MQINTIFNPGDAVVIRGERGRHIVSGKPRLVYPVKRSEYPENEHETAFVSEDGLVLVRADKEAINDAD